MLVMNGTLSNDIGMLKDLLHTLGNKSQGRMLSLVVNDQKCSLFY